MDAGKKTSAARIAAVKRYQARVMYNLGIKINKETETDIYNHLRGMDNKRAYILDLIRRDMRNAEKN